LFALTNAKSLHVSHFTPLPDTRHPSAGTVWGTRGPEFESRRPDSNFLYAGGQLHATEGLVREHDLRDELELAAGSFQTRAQINSSSVVRRHPTESRSSFPRPRLEVGFR
jgi:hypothetical protein